MSDEQSVSGVECRGGRPVWVETGFGLSVPVLSFEF